MDLLAACFVIKFKKRNLILALLLIIPLNHSFQNSQHSRPSSANREGKLDHPGIGDKRARNIFNSKLPIP